MKIINARTGQLQPIPFVLGQRGRGRWEETIELSRRPGQTPTGPEDVGYVPYGEKRVLLTAGNATQRGVLVRVDTQGPYTKNSDGEIGLLDGSPAKLLARGVWANGIAGNCGSGLDNLYHVEGAAIFKVTISGGEHKGFGLRWLVVTASFAVRLLKEQELCQIIATDDDPDISATCQKYRDQLPKAVQTALDTAARLDAAPAVLPSTAPAIQHLERVDRPLLEAFALFDIAVPVSMVCDGKLISGVSKVEGGTILPGDKPAVFLEMGSGGGKRYSFELVKLFGLTRLHGKPWSEYDTTGHSRIFAIDIPGFYAAWKVFKDGKILAYFLADATGIHRLEPGSQRPETFYEWAGVKPQAPSKNRFADVFGTL